MSATKSTEESVCGHCGYAVRGLDSFTCPECGSDLREVGIVAPSPTTLSRCGNCGHTFRQLSTYDCPDCGADLREVGIVPIVSNPPRYPLWQVLATWTLAYWIFASIVLTILPSDLVPAATIIVVVIWMTGYYLIARGHWSRTRPPRG